MRAWFDNLAVEATEALAALADVARDKATTTGRVAEVLDLIDPATTPEATISAYRRAARAWTRLDNLDDYAPLARAMAFNDVSDTPNEGRDVFARMEELASHRARFHALVFDAEACALAVFDMSPVKAMAAGLGKVAPLADPLGDDLPELERRLAVVTAAAVPWVTATVALRGSTASMIATVSPPRRRHWQRLRPSVRTCLTIRRAIMTLTRPPTFTPSNPHGRAIPHGVAVSPSRLMAAGTTSPRPRPTGGRPRRGRPSQVG
ncbi:hypothetical protein [Corynebacterium diphtheriae]|uniref:hypothetical protein n=1 Tax=Corynebacterium diphtheriae TaxID=1717 RepID=UPI000B4B00E5|nr:hypothetical protein [Corynebacterium diphtheriae]OWN05098.1 hypothetical protein AY473_00965 [Corynebacterium diphtheriae bv. mitis]OWO27829.1 hypothetical protein AY536_10860 [Corynebacterium diphtheriae bv. mitis]OWX98767.1 hypothetical protein B1A53_07710 [Corynebacterium diphtheriae]CAB0693930.1 hypothetical protein FRC0032_01101 [Corynebacterium diphtheriae]CAB0761824.1 hypothetical protein FRC0137_02080 [Corynebacterium diphtheriae]